MNGFTELEPAVLHSMFAEVPDLARELERQLSVAKVAARENTGAGFFTTISLPATVEPLHRSEPLDGATHARLPDVEHGLGFVLFFDEGRIKTLEGFTYASESTTALDLDAVPFEIVKVLVNRAS